MGLLDTLARQVGGNLLGAAGQPAFLAQLLQEAGGLPGLAQRFEQAGLGEVFGSWVGRGPNQRIDAAQLVTALGAENLDNLARRVGLDRNLIGAAMISVLPAVIDRLTPDGTLPKDTPQPQQLQEALSEAMKQAASAFFGRGNKAP
jgi:uncharacterized protein YidB (DUF937 family)